MHICIYIYTHTHTHAYIYIHIHTYIQGDDAGKQKGAGLNLGEIVNVVKIPGCRTLTIYMMLTGLAGSIYHSTFSMAASSQFGMDAK